MSSISSASLSSAAAPSFPLPIPEYIQNLLDLPDSRDCFTGMRKILGGTADVRQIDELTRNEQLKASVTAKQWSVILADAEVYKSCLEEELRKRTALSPDYIQELIEKSDVAFFESLLDIIATAPDQQKIKQFLDLPVLKARLSVFNDLSLDHLLSMLVQFLIKNPGMQEAFIAKQLNKMHTFLMLCDRCKVDFGQVKDWEVLPLLYSPTISPAIKEPLKAIYSLLEKKENVQSETNISLIPNILHQKTLPVEIQQDGMRFDTQTLYLAVDVGNLINGWDFQPNAIKLWFHQPPPGPSRKRDLVIKHIEEFESGRRNFIFQPVADVPFENYKLLMTYMIDTLKRDRENYYQQHRDYLDPAIYEKCALNMDQNGDGRAFAERYRFEWAARAIVQLEKEVKDAHTDLEIKRCLKKFEKYQPHLCNCNIDLTLASSIAEQVFSLEYGFKPVRIQGVPPDLSRIATRIGIGSDAAPSTDFAKEELLKPLTELATKSLYHPPQVKEILKRMRRLYGQIAKDPSNKALMKEFLDLWYSIPLNKMLTEEKKAWQMKDPKVDIAKYIDELQAQFGISQDQMRKLSDSLYSIRTTIVGDQELVAFDKAIRELRNRYREVFFPVEFDPGAAAQGLRQLQSELELLLKSSTTEKKNKIVEFSQDLDKALTRSAPFNPRNHELDFDSLIYHAKHTIGLPIPGVEEKIFAFRKALSEKYRSLFEHLHHVSSELLQLKQFIIQELLLNKDLSSHAIIPVRGALHLIRQFELAIADEVRKDRQSEEKGAQLGSLPPTHLRLISEIAVSQGAVDTVVSDLPSLKKALEKAREKIPSFAEIRRPIINTPKALELLESNAKTVESFMQEMQTALHSDMTALLDSLLDVKNDQGLSGTPTMTGDVLGKLRFIRPGAKIEPAKPGEILVIEYAAPEVHQYKDAAAIISRQGGIFSHAAITFSELGIPALIGCDIDLLRPLDGQAVHLHLSDTPKVQRVDPALLDKPLTAQEIEALPENDIKEVLRRILNQDAIELSRLEKRLYSTDHPMEKVYLFNKLEKKLDQSDPRYAELQRRALELVPHRHAFVSKGGKKENLDYLTEVIPGLSTPTLKFKVPPYRSFTAEELVWSRNPALKQQILSLLHSDLTNAEKSQQITRLIGQIPLDDLALDGEYIVRSSAKLEDRAKSAAAGIFESVRVREKSSDAFRQVLASAFSERALAFFGANDALLDMTWVVQKYIAGGQYSGVAFSVADEKDWNVAGMQIVPGLGGGVDGKQTPAFLTVDTYDMTLAERRVEQGKKLPCDIKIAKEIALLTKKLEADYKCPIEIEFVGDGDTVYIVQIRPITKYF